MRSVVPVGRSISLALSLSLLLALAATPAGAFPLGLNDWQGRYGAVSPAGDNARCQLCHVNSNGGSPWNAYGWDMVLALDNLACDLDGDADVSNLEALFCIELLNSDGDGSNIDNVSEIGLGTQPGWTNGPFNAHFNRAGVTTGHLPPENIGLLDPEGTEPPPPPPPPPVVDDGPPLKLKKKIVVKPGDSIQDALDRIKPGGTIIVKPGIYRELADSTNGLNITKSGIRLIGETKPKKVKKIKKAKKVKLTKAGSKKVKKIKEPKPDRVILQNAGNQRNGIVVVPPARTDCMSCHTDMAPPFPLAEGVPPGFPKEDEPWLYDIEIRGITIQGFVNNGLFTEHVDGFVFDDVASVENKNYGIFPTLSRNGVISNSYASGSDDSGIWVETSENVTVSNSLVEDNVNGFEVSNSDDILIVDSEARNNAIGAAILLLPDIFDDRAGAKRIDMRNNFIHGNNKPNTARPGSILASVPSGSGILYVGVDDSLISENRVEDNSFIGIALVDYCLAVLDTPFSCDLDPDAQQPGFFEDNLAVGNRVIGNTFIDNGLDPVSHPFDFAAGDMGTLSFLGGCYEDNIFTSFIHAVIGGPPPPCP